MSNLKQGPVILIVHMKSYEKVLIKTFPTLEDMYAYYAQLQAERFHISQAMYTFEKLRLYDGEIHQVLDTVELLDLIESSTTSDSS